MCVYVQCVCLYWQFCDFTLWHYRNASSVWLPVYVFLFLQTRRSMVFAKHLRLIGDSFRAKHLNSTDNQDQTIYSEDWTRMKVSIWKSGIG